MHDNSEGGSCAMKLMIVTWSYAWYDKSRRQEWGWGRGRKQTNEKTTKKIPGEERGRGA